MTCKLKISLKAAIYVIYQRRFKDIKLTKIIKWEGAGGEGISYDTNMELRREVTSDRDMRHPGNCTSNRQPMFLASAVYPVNSFESIPGYLQVINSH